MAGLAMHSSAEPETLVIRVGLEERDGLVEDAPETYYLTDYYRSYSLVLVRLSRVDDDALRDLLSVSWRMVKAARTIRAGARSSDPLETPLRAGTYAAISTAALSRSAETAIVAGSAGSKPAIPRRGEIDYCLWG